MRILAHYTVFGGKIYHLHVFEIFGSGTILHFHVDGETSNTCFIEGVAVVCKQIGDAEYSELQSLLREHAGDSPSEVADLSKEFLESHGLVYDGGDFSVLRIEMPSMNLERMM